MGRALGRKKITLTLTEADTNYQITPSRIFASDFEVYVPNGNAGAIVYIGSSEVDATWIPRARGTLINYLSGNGTLAGPDAPIAFDLSQMYVRGVAAGDTVIVEYAAFTSV